MLLLPLAFIEPQVGYISGSWSHWEHISHRVTIMPKVNNMTLFTETVHPLNSHNRLRNKSTSI